MVHLLGVVAIAARCALGPSLFTAVLSVLGFDLFFIPPALEFAWPDARNVLTFVGMVVVAGVISRLNQGLRKEREAARRSEASATALFHFCRDLAELSSQEQLGSFVERLAALGAYRMWLRRAALPRKVMPAPSIARCRVSS